MPNPSRVAARYVEAIRLPAMPRPAYIPTHIRGKEQVVDTEGTDLTIWTWEDGDKLRGIAFVANQSKPLWNYRFRNEAERQREIRRAIAVRKSALESKSNREKERKEFQHDFAVGDILCASWGHDQTNVDFYEVTALHPKAIIVRAVASETVRTGHGADYVVAVPGSYAGPPMAKRPQPGGRIKIDGHYARKWDGKPAYATSFESGH